MKKNYIVCILLFTVLLNGFGVDIYVPSLPVMQQWFHTSHYWIQLSIGSYLLGFALIQLIIGSICDSVGRRIPYLIALIAYIILSWMIAQTTHINVLLTLRFFQGLAVGAYIISCRAMFVDLFQGKKLQLISNYIAITYSIGSIIAPIIGAYLQHYFGWQMNFYFLGAYALICFMLALFFVPETLIEKHPWNLAYWIDSSKKILCQREFWIVTLIIGSIYDLLILFNVVAPFLVESVMHYSIVVYGYVALTTGLAWFLGTLTNRLLHNIDKAVKVKYGYFLLLISSMILLFLSTQMINLYALVIPISFIFYLGGIVFSAYYAQSITIFPSAIAATAGAFMGVVVMIMASVLGSFVGAQLKSTTAIPLASVVLLFLLLSGILSFIEQKTVLKSIEGKNIAIE